MKIFLSALFFTQALGSAFSAGVDDNNSRGNPPGNNAMENRLVISVDSITGSSLYVYDEDEQPMNTRSFSPGRIPKALIIYADPESHNLSAAARDRMAELLVSRGWEVEVRNLYEEAFNPVATAEEVSFSKNAGVSSDPQVAEYQILVKQADALILVYPLWWKQPPAMLKGWQDRVFSYGFAYEFVNNSPDSVISLLAGKKVLIINVAADSRTSYRDREYLHYLNMADASLYGLSGIELAGRHVIFSSGTMNNEEKKAALDNLSDLIPLIEPSY